MKKGILVFVLVALVGWTFYDQFIAEDNDTLHGMPVIDGNAEEAAIEVQDNDQDLTVPDQSEMEFGFDIGDRVPDFELEDVHGETVRMSDYEGKKVILNFWASWCPPCRAEMPDMQQFYEDYKDEGVEIVAVNATNTPNEDQEAMEDFIDEYGLTFTIPMDVEGEVGDQFQVMALPTSYIVDEEGMIHQRIVGPMNYEWMQEQVQSM